jgi:hypothetical protein
MKIQISKPIDVSVFMFDLRKIAGHVDLDQLNMFSVYT